MAPRIHGLKPLFLLASACFGAILFIASASVIRLSVRMDHRAGQQSPLIRHKVALTAGSAILVRLRARLLQYRCQRVPEAVACSGQRSR